MAIYSSCKSMQYARTCVLLIEGMGSNSVLYTPARDQTNYKAKKETIANVVY